MRAFLRTAVRWLMVLVSVTVVVAHPSYADRQAESCRPASPSPAPAPAPTTVDTIRQAYYCIFDHYYSGSTLDGRLLLTSAFAGFVEELQRRGVDLADARMPALSGDRDDDWTRFGATYRRMIGRLPADPQLRQALAAAALDAMTASLRDNHARWIRMELPPDAAPGDAYGLGIDGLSAPRPPLFVTAVLPKSPAARKGIRPGDVIESVNGSSPYAAGVLSPGVQRLLDPRYPERRPVVLRLRRPATGLSWTVTVRPELFPAPPPAAVTRRLSGGSGDVAYVALPAFFPGAADQILRAVTRLREGRSLRGVILDLRGNHGGSPTEVNRLLGAFAHDKVTAYLCEADGACAASMTDDAVPLLNLPLITLTDHICGSACDHFAAAVKDQRIGPLVGTRTAGIVSGPANGYVLSDNSLLLLPRQHHLGPEREMIDGIGVPPDHYVPRSARDLSTGRDRGVERALGLLG